MKKLLFVLALTVSACFGQLQYPKQVNLLSDLASLSPTAAGTVLVLGKTTVGDADGGIFYWKKSDSTAADGTDIIASNRDTTGRWYRLTSLGGTGAVAGKLDKLNGIGTNLTVKSKMTITNTPGNFAYLELWHSGAPVDKKGFYMTSANGYLNFGPIFDDGSEFDPVLSIDTLGNILTPFLNNGKILISQGSAIVAESTSDASTIDGLTGNVQTNINARLSAASSLADVADPATARANIGALRKVDTIAALKALTGSDVTNMVHVLGYYAAGDMGGGTYYWSSSDTTTTNSGSAFYRSGSTTGRWLLKHDGTVRAEQWGLKGDNSQDNSALLQELANLTSVDTGRTIKTIEFSNGTYLCDGVVFGHWNGSAWDDVTGLTLKGVGGRTANVLTSIIKSTVGTKPALIFQKCKGLTISGLSVRGVNTISPTISNIANDATFWVAGSTNQYSPYAGIALDPFASAVASTNQYSGMSAYYLGSSSGGSSRVTFYGCGFRDFVVGLAVGTSGVGLQDEEIVMRECEFTNVRDATAWGHSQTRACALVDCHFEGLRSMVNGVDYGLKGSTWTGGSPNIVGGDWLICQRAIQGNDNWSGMSVVGAYGEELLSLGTTSRGNSQINKPTLFTGCNFAFHNTGASAGGANYHWASLGGLTKFTGCTLETSGDLPFMLYVKDQADNSPGVIFDTCDFYNSNASWADPNMPFGVFCNNYNNVKFVNCLMNGVRVVSDGTVASSWTGISRNWALPGTRFSVAGVSYATVPQTLNFSYGTASTYGVNNGDGTAAMTFSGGFGNYVKVNDFLYKPVDNATWYPSSDKPYNYLAAWSGIVSAVATNYLTGTVRGIPYNLISAGTNFLSYPWVLRIPRVHPPTYGDTTSGSATISNVSPDPTLYWAVGDAIQGPTIRAGAYISALTSSSITLNVAGAGLTTQTKADLYDAIYTPTSSDSQRFMRQTASLTLNTWDSFVAVAQDTRTITLCAANGVAAGKQFWISDTTGTLTSGGPITVTPAGSDTINGVSGSYSMASDKGTVVLTSDGASNWLLMKGGLSWNMSGSTNATLVGNASFNAGTVTNGFTDQSLTASQTVQTDSNKRLVTVATQPSVITLTDGATITWTCDSTKRSQLATVTLGGNRTLAFASTAAGMDGYLRVVQDGTGSRTLTLPGSSKVVSGGAGAVTLTTTANAIDVLCWYYDGTYYYWTLSKNFN